jgi:alkylhydroperoxidase/carboxymuconolactone decarboxylase family protein YurZ
LSASKNPWMVFSEECSGVASAFQNLMKEANFNEVLGAKTRLLVLVGIFSATRDPVALRHYVGEAIKAGASKREIEAAALLPFSTGVTSAELSIPLICDIFEKQT